MQDRGNLPYLNALLLESHRCVAHVPLGKEHLDILSNSDAFQCNLI